MIHLPDELRPITAEPFSLPDGQIVAVAKASPTFPLWPGASLPYTFGDKPVLDYRGTPCFAELVILRLLVAVGWSARWVVTYGAAAMRPRLLTTWASGGLRAQVSEPIPDAPIQSQLDAVAQANGGTYSGCWDIVAWQEGCLLFAEAKRQGRDRLRTTQRRWFAAALATGLSPEAFLVVEWSPA